MHSTDSFLQPTNRVSSKPYLGLLLDGSQLPVRHGKISSGIAASIGPPGAVWDNAVGCPANMIW
jgi:hypothetical protein